jgi:hypothetical protein
LPQREKFNFAKQTKETVPLEEGRDNFSKEKLSEGVLKHRKKRTPPSSKNKFFE